MRILLAVIMLAAPCSASALNLNARLTASLHSWERQDTDSTSVAHNTIHQLVSLRLKDFGVQGLSFHAYGRGFVHAEGSEGRTRLALYSTYADWKGIVKRLDIRFGRQRIFAGVARGTFDGGRATFSLPQSVKLLAYAGVAAPTDRSTRLGSWDKSHVYGFRASVRRWKTTLSLSFANEAREAAGGDLTGPRGEELNLTTLARRQVGGEIRSTYLSKTDLYGRVDVETVYWKPTRIQVRGRRKATKNLTLSGEFDYRRPPLDANSFLSVFHLKTNKEVEGKATYRLQNDYNMSGSYSVVLFTDDETHRMRLGLSRGASSISYYRRSGYGGDRDGVSLGSRHGISSKLSMRGSINYSKYRLSDVQEERNKTLAGVLALDYMEAGKLAASLEGHVLENQTYDYDFRLFAKVTWWINVVTQAS
jgi:hypothetical protein